MPVDGETAMEAERTPTFPSQSKEVTSWLNRLLFNSPVASQKKKKRRASLD